MRTGELNPRELRYEVEELLYEYAQVLDDGDLEQWPELFTADGLYEIVSRENVARGLRLALMRCESKGMMVDRVIALREANFYAPRWLRRMITNVRVPSAGDDGLVAQSNFAVYQTLVDGNTSLLATGRYVDKIVVEGGRLRFSRKRCIYDTCQIPNTIAFPL